MLEYIISIGLLIITGLIVWILESDYRKVAKRYKRWKEHEKKRLLKLFDEN